MGGHSGQSLRINVQMCVHGCDGAELHLNGTVVPYRRGKAIAWQDGWRHEILNSGEEPRWVFMITIPHPELEDAFARADWDWPKVHESLFMRGADSASGEFSAMRYVSSSFSPWSASQKQDQGCNSARQLVEMKSLLQDWTEAFFLDGPARQKEVERIEQRLAAFESCAQSAA